MQNYLTHIMHTRYMLYTDGHTGTPITLQCMQL